MAEEMLKMNYNLISNGTDTHLVLVDLSKLDISGKLAENKLEEAGITVNKNMIPYDKKSPMVTSGIRIGTPAVTTRGMKENDMIHIVRLIDKVLKKPNDESNIKSVKAEVGELCNQYPIYQGLDK